MKKLIVEPQTLERVFSAYSTEENQKKIVELTYHCSQIRNKVSQLSKTLQIMTAKQIPEFNYTTSTYQNSDLPFVIFIENLPSETKEAVNLLIAGYNIDNVSSNNTQNNDVQNNVPIIKSFNHEKFTHFQEEAKKLRKWCFVYVKHDKYQSTKNSQQFEEFDLPQLKKFFLYDFMESRFHGLELDPDDVCTKWFKDYYNIPHVPCIAIIHPDTGACLSKYNGVMTPQKITEFLNDFFYRSYQFLAR